LNPKAEEAIVKCLEMCGEFNFPMGNKKLQTLVQDYCIEYNVSTRDSYLPYLPYNTVPVGYNSIIIV
jgi:hypothetical protein